MKYWIIAHDNQGREILGSSGTAIFSLKTLNGVLGRAKAYRWDKRATSLKVFRVPDSDKYRPNAVCWQNPVATLSPVLFDGIF